MKNPVATILLAIIILLLIGCQPTDEYSTYREAGDEAVEELEGVKLGANYDTNNFNNKKDVFKIFDPETCHMIYVTESGGIVVVNIKDIWRTAGELREMFPGCGT